MRAPEPEVDLFHRPHADIFATVRTLDFKHDFAMRLSKKRMALTTTDVNARMKPGAALAHQDIAGLNELAAETFNA